MMTFHFQLFIAGCVSVLSASSLVNGYSVLPVQKTTQMGRRASASSDESEVNLSRRSFVTVGVSTSMVAFGVAFQHPTVASAETIRTMDFSLPSYDAISDARAGSDLLTLEENPLTGTTVKTVPKKVKREDSSVAGTPMTPEEKQKLAKERSAARLAAEAEKQAAKDASAGERAAEKAAKEAEKARQQAMSDADRAAQQATAKQLAKEKAAAKALEEEKKAAAKESMMKYSSADFVDMALPSYSESAKVGGKEKSMFSL
jgi:flagellar biosynthesis GTPase FlhF